MDAREFDDNTIMGRTSMRTKPDGLAQLHMVLPSGRELESEIAPPDALRRVMISWCNSVREQIGADAAIAATAKKLASSMLHAPALASTPVAVATEPVEPEDYVTGQYAAAQRTVHELALALSNAQFAYDQAQERLAQWKKVNDALLS